VGGEGPQRGAGRLSPLDDLVHPPEPWPHEGIAGWWARATPFARELSPADSALRLGAHADRVAYAFAAGYLGALSALVPDRDRTKVAALCATEAGGVHPRAVEATFDGARVTGEKSFVTFAVEAEELLVLAKEGEIDGRPALALVRVAASDEGVSVSTLPETPFVPEIGHGAVRLDGARGERLDGDGWADYVRPFRTVEDLHVHLAFMGWLIASACRWGAPEATVEAGLAQAMALRALCGEDPGAPSTHVALAGAIDAASGLVEGFDWSVAPPEDRARFERDRALLRVASKARARRRERAWERVRASDEAPRSPGT